jgi:hypothetical protein
MADVEDLEGGGASTPFVKRQSSSGGISLGSHQSAPSSLEYSGSVSGAAASAKSPSHKVAHAYLSKYSPNTIRSYGVIILLATALVCPFLSIEWCILVLVFASCAFGAVASIWLSHSVLQCDDGTVEMRAVSDPIREGAEGFLKVQYTVRYCFELGVSWRPNEHILG